MPRIRNLDPAEGMDVRPDQMGTDVYPLAETERTILHRCKEKNCWGEPNTVEPLRFNAGRKSPRDPSLGGGSGRP